jgi:hypothetical protein
MAKHRIAWLPGDGIGVEVLEAAEVVLDKLRLDAEYPVGDIGWKFWCKEGDPLPPRTIELLKNVIRRQTSEAREWLRQFPEQISQLARHRSAPATPLSRPRLNP